MICDEPWQLRNPVILQLLALGDATSAAMLRRDEQHTLQDSQPKQEHSLGGNVCASSRHFATRNDAMLAHAG